MRMMKFSAIYLLSMEERAATSLTFEPDLTVLQAPNGYGKSGILKSLYETFGADPHRVDSAWKNGKIASAVVFEIDGIERTIVKFLGTFAVFSADGSLLLKTSSVGGELAPFLAELMDFKLQMVDRNEKIVTPPPAYIFAPYYIDQDKSWASAWVPFQKLYLPNSTRTLIEYHSGLKPNAYYDALAKRDLLSSKQKDAEIRQGGLQSAFDHVTARGEEPSFHLGLADFIEETEQLVAESARLMDLQAEYRRDLAELIERKALWITQLSVARAALSESDAIFDSAVNRPREVECPTCGAHYTNDITTRFAIAADSGSLMAVVLESQDELHRVQNSIDSQHFRIDALVSAHAKIEAILRTHRNETTLHDLLRSEGRNEAAKLLRDQMAKVKEEIGGYALEIKTIVRDLRAIVDKSRAKQIQNFFETRFGEAAKHLDVRMPSDVSMARTSYARGSEGPRGIAAYFYSFIHTARKFGSSAFCPVVIDAPNQQGQDGQHLPAILSYLLESRPQGAQLILGIEDTIEVEVEERAIRQVGYKKHRLLDPKNFEQVDAYMRPMLAQIIGELS